MKFIGKGSFTKCFLMDCGKRVQLVTCDPIKEAMAWGWFPDSPLFPKLSFISLGVYEMDYMPSSRGLKGELEPEQWEIYKALRDCFAKNVQVTRRDELYHAWYESFEMHADAYAGSYIEVAFRDLMEALDTCSNFGTDVAFEISPRNVRAVNGKLVLLDCFFLVSKLDEVKSK
ncbi:hypothetical protein A2a_b_00017 [Klebsiella phage VLCpiA2a]|nr:hypothetical protein A2a_b_00017 [Klebsiella phage VLCpiA2a]